jgi:hypothetical protein
MFVTRTTGNDTANFLVAAARTRMRAWIAAGSLGQASTQAIQHQSAHLPPGCPKLTMRASLWGLILDW